MHKNNRSLPHDIAVDGLMETHSHQSICWTALWNINLRLMSFASLWMQNETATKNDDDLMKNQEREKWMLSPFSPCESDLNAIQLGAAAVADEGWTANGWRNRERDVTTTLAYSSSMCVKHECEIIIRKSCWLRGCGCRLPPVIDANNIFQLLCARFSTVFVVFHFLSPFLKMFIRFQSGLVRAFGMQ